MPPSLYLLPPLFFSFTLYVCLFNCQWYTCSHYLICLCIFLILSICTFSSACWPIVTINKLVSGVGFCSMGVNNILIMINPSIQKGSINTFYLFYRVFTVSTIVNIFCCLIKIIELCAPIRHPISSSMLLGCLNHV